MPPLRSPTLSIRARGPLACFSRPELKAERMSYPVMTPSAARGLLEAILWKPAIRWQVLRIKVLAPIQLTAYRRNEVNAKAATPAAPLVSNGGSISTCNANDDRNQRNTIALRDVDYVIEACIRMTGKAGPDDTLSKFVDEFQRRVEHGQHFHQPYFGCREMIAEVEPVTPGLQPIELSHNLGAMLWDIDYSGKQRRPIFFAARLENGVLEVPEDPEASVPSMEAAS